MFLHALLSDEVVQPAWSERPFGVFVPVLTDGDQKITSRHAALRSAKRTRSSVESSGSMPERAASASRIDQPSSTRAARASILPDPPQ